MDASNEHAPVINPGAQSAVRSCPFCAAPVTADRDVCALCGRDPTASRRSCRSCQRMTPSAERSCWNCGAKMHSELHWKIPLVIFLLLLSLVLGFASFALR